MPEDNDFNKAIKAMEKLTILDKFRVMRNASADIYSEEVKDEVFDNGFLTSLSTLTIQIEALIEFKIKRNGQ